MRRDQLHYALEFFPLANIDSTLNALANYKERLTKDSLINLYQALGYKCDDITTLVSLFN